MDLSVMKMFLEAGAFPVLALVLWFLVSKRIPTMEKNFLEEHAAIRDTFREELRLEREEFSKGFEKLAGPLKTLTTAVRRQSAILIYHDATSAHSSEVGDSTKELLEHIIKLDEDDEPDDE